MWVTPKKLSSPYNDRLEKLKHLGIRLLSAIPTAHNATVSLVTCCKCTEVFENEQMYRLADHHYSENQS